MAITKAYFAETDLYFCFETDDGIHGCINSDAELDAYDENDNSVYDFDEVEGLWDIWEYAYHEIRSHLTHVNQNIMCELALQKRERSKQCK